MDRCLTRRSRWIWTSGLLYPLLTLGSVGIAAVALDWHLPSFWVLAAVQILGVLLVTVLEFLLPYRSAWLHSHGDLKTDLAHLTFTKNFAVGAQWFVSVIFIALTGRAEVGHLTVWPTEWPVVPQVVLATLVHGFFGYWLHRAQHQVPLLWRMHAIHHSAPRVYWLNQARSHPIEALLDGCTIIPLVILGAPAQVLFLFAAFSGMHLALQHANIDIRLGSFNWLLSMSEVHRWHHSRKIEEANGNYGGILLLWDALFRTRIAPKDGDSALEVGLGEPAKFPQNYLGQLAAPFRRRLWTRTA
jgi:sterol desaturase/sphingolipid hydroxylase (fatty acid hydroxylase superfamily)